MSNIFITLDYELFFGHNPGSQYQSIIYPTKRLLKIFDKYNVKATFFIDSGYLLKLNEYKNHYPILEKDFFEITSQIQKISENGHDIQLHIHPHWEDSYFDGERWRIITKRYRLHEFSENKINNIISKYKSVVEEYADNPIFTFRAGGWCIQPFNKLKNPLKENNIWLDSTIFHNGKNNSKTHFFNFRNAPIKTCWKFEKDPLSQENKGFFTEIPISSIKVAPLFFWKLAYTKKFGTKKHVSFGDGVAAGGSKWDVIRMLTWPTNTVVSIDGYKSRLLKKAFDKFQSKYSSDDNFVIIGHPKALSEYSLKKLEDFIQHAIDDNKFLTYSNWALENKETITNQ